MERETIEQTLERFTGMFKGSSLWRDEYEPYLGQFFSFFVRFVRGVISKSIPALSPKKHFKGGLNYLDGYCQNIMSKFPDQRHLPKS